MDSKERERPTDIETLAERADDRNLPVHQLLELVPAPAAAVLVDRHRAYWPPRWT